MTQPNELRLQRTWRTHYAPTNFRRSHTDEAQRELRRASISWPRSTSLARRSEPQPRREEESHRHPEAFSNCRAEGETGSGSFHPKWLQSSDRHPDYRM